MAFDKAIPIFEYLKNTQYCYYSYAGAAPILTRQGNLEKALKYLEQAERHSLVLGNKAFEARMLVEQAIVQIAQQDTGKAIMLLNEALAIPEIRNKPFNAAAAYHRLANVYIKKQKFSEANRNLNNGLAFAKSIRDPDLSASFSSALGELALTQKDYPKATLQYQLALRYADSSTSPKYRREVAKIYITIGKLKLTEIKPEEALTAYHEALRRILPRFNSTDLTDSPLSSDFYNENVILVALLGKAKAFHAQYKISQDPTDLQHALQNHELAISAADELRKGIDYDASTLLVSAYGHQGGEEALEIAFKLFELTGENKYLEKAFWLMEQNKSWALRNNLNKIAQNRMQEVPDSLITQIRELGMEITLTQTEWLSLKGLEDSQSKKIEALRIQSNSKRELLQQKLNLLKREHPEFYKLSFGEDVPPLSQIQNQLASGTLLLNFFYGDSSIYILGISRDKVQHHRVATAEIGTRVREFISLVKNPNWIGGSKEFDQYVTIGHALYRSLVQPMISGNPTHLVIAHDGPLGYLMFDALLTEIPADVMPFSELPYLLKKMTIWQTYSASLMESTDIKPSEGKFPYLGIAPLYPKGNARGLRPVDLENARVQHIASNWKGETLIHENATYQQVLTQLSHSRILHFFGHALADEEDADLSYFALSLPDENIRIKRGAAPNTAAKDSTQIYTLSAKPLPEIAGQGGLLFAKDLQQQQLTAELAVLSACQTGLGKFARGEGIMSLARAFRYAGCENVLMSLWFVEESATGTLVESYFSHLKKKKGKADALRLAKLDYLAKTPERSHPFFWSTFVLVGNNEPISQKGNGWVYVLVGLGLVLILVWVGRKHRWF